MSDLEDYPKEHPETGKVKNPLTSNWVQKSYARDQGILEQAEQNTQQHFKEQDSNESEADEIDRLLQEAENLDADEAFEIDDLDLDDLDDDELERLDEHAEINHPEIPDSQFPNEEDFAAEGNKFDQPPTPEGLEDAARQQQGTGEYKGVYSGKNAGRNPAAQQAQSTSENKSLQDKHDDDEVRYVKTEHGGMKMVYPNKDNE